MSAEAELAAYVAPMRALLAGADAEIGLVPLWVGAPTFLIDARYEQLGDWRASPRYLRHLRHWATAAGRSRGAPAVLHDGVLYVLGHPNLERVLDPVIAERVARAGGTPQQVAQPIPPRDLVAWTRRARTSEKAAVAAFGVGSRTPAALSVTLDAAARALSRAQRLVQHHEPSAVVVATQHATSSRAFLHVAHRHGLPTVYVPHAPVADNVQYRDLPVHYAGLRGPGEVEFYRACGVSGRLDVVGDPSPPADPAPGVVERSDAGTTVFAPSPLGIDPVQRQVHLVAEALGADVVVSPHPGMRTDPRYAALWPDNWRVHAGRTIDLIAGAARCVVQHSSGVALEALAHGVPVIQLALPGDPPPRYPAIVAPHVTFVESADALRDAVRDLAGLPTKERQAAADWSRHWCATTGVAAANATAALVSEARDRGAAGTELLWDAWRESGVRPGEQ